MKINIVCYEDPDQWICGKIARRLAESLCKLGHACALERSLDESADVNHHIIYLNYLSGGGGLHTLMVTHIDNALKLGRLREGLKSTRAAICMSRETVENLNVLGVDRQQLTYAHMAHDGKAIGRKFVVGLTTRLYPDGRKREADLLKLLDHISPDDFCFRIMGFGWQSIVETMRQKGYGVDYQADFDYERYMLLLAGLDYYLYMGNDEGSSGFIDALAAGVKTIVNPQGFHLDAVGGITHPVRNFEELRSVFCAIAEDKRTRTDAVRGWTWENYARRHVKIWEACLGGRPLPDEPAEGSLTVGSSHAARLRLRLWANVFLHRARMVLNIRKEYECQSRIWDWRRTQSKGKEPDKR